MPEWRDSITDEPLEPRRPATVGWHKAKDGTMLEVFEDAVRTCPECGSENAYECPDPAEWGVLVCWCDGLDTDSSL